MMGQVHHTPYLGRGVRLDKEDDWLSIIQVGSGREPGMRYSFKAALTAGLLVLSTAAHAATMTVMKSPACGCCGKWVEHAEKHGFTVKVVNVEDIMAVKAKAGVPDELASCHTSMVEGYVVEGHVPAEDIKKLLAQKPKARGIAVPGMPGGSPGMEHAPKQPYQTLLIKSDGTTSVFASH